ncbi:hypothetical protein FB451DRAFT_1559506 [Mycena latifolia]|nr:hypothetical protein FB451DRAFT_1559506 [Mycena latifolia]
MQRLPYELLDTICSLLCPEDLWSLAQVSSHFHRNTVFPLSRFGIPGADIESGILSLSHSLFLIPIFARVRPIRKLVCFEQDEGGRHGYEKLTRILSATAPIPDILIHDRYSLTKDPPRTARLLWCIPHVRRSTLLLIKHGSISVSRPRTVAGLQWKWTPLHFELPCTNFPSWLTKIITIAILCVPLATYLVSGIMNLGALLSRVYERFLAPLLDQRSRIEADIRPLYPEYWMRIDSTVRIQTLATEAEDFTAVTIAGELSRQMRITAIPLDRDVYSALLASLELTEHLVHLTIEQHSNLAHADLMTFIQRHPNLETIVFEPDSILHDSLVPSRPRAFSGKTRILSAPAVYIPHVISAAPNVGRILVTITEPRNPEKIWALQEYYLALRSIAELSANHPLVLTLAFNSANELPWAHVLAEGEKAVEARLHRVEEVILSARRPFKFTGAAIRWLGSFPSLKRVLFNPRCLTPMSINEQHALAAMRRGVVVYFRLSEHDFTSGVSR